MMLLTILALFFQSLYPNSDFIEKGWKGIVPLVTKKTEVENKIGKPYRIGNPKTMGHSIHFYETAKGTIYIKYSTARCQNNGGKTGSFDVPIDTVVEYRVFPKQELKFSDLKLSIKKYSKFYEQSDFTDFSYKNDDDGIEITTKKKGGIEYIYYIDFAPRIKNINYRECKSNLSLEVEKGIEGIIPFKSNRTDVEKLFGKPNDYDRYEKEDANIHFTYSTEPCQKDDLGRGDYNIPKDTVLRYQIYLHKPLKFSELKYDAKRYVQNPDIDTTYENKKDGILILTEKRNGSEYVGSVIYNPPKHIENLKCKTLK